jgi:DNA polymerase-3 subunit chi
MATPLAAETPILITDKLDTLPQDERLMNLSQIVPPGFSRFHSLIEVVGQEEADRNSARERVKFYKDRGYEVRYFDLGER